MVLNGLFPPTEELTWKEGENWLPFATIYDKEGTDKVFIIVTNKFYNT